MAGAHSAAAVAAAATTSSPFPPAAPIPSKSAVLASSLPSSFPSRGRRTNHLRRKILKTLENKPYPDTYHSQFPRTPPSILVDEKVLQQTAEADQFSESTGFVDGILGTFSTKSSVKIGLYLVGAFVFQTICALLIFGSNDLEDKDGNLTSDDSKKPRVNNEWKSKSNLLSSRNRSLFETEEGGMVLVDESEMDNRIMEIQEMAREARQQERLNAKSKGLVEEENDDIDYDLIDKTIKEKEVDDRLMKLRKSLEGNYDKPPSTFPKKESDVSNNDDKGSLMFKKKYKYKSLSIDSADKPKGFNGTNDNHIDKGTVVNGIAADGVDKNEQIGLSSGNGLEASVSVDKSKGQELQVTKTESTTAGTSKEPQYNKQAGRAAKLGKPSNLETRKPRGFGKEINDADFNKNDSLKGKKGGNRKSARNLGEMKSSPETDFWWTRLPYVMAVLMQRSGNSEESEGLFTLRSTSQTKLSHTVAFEDRSDATNFCYLLESFFEDLGDFSTNIIPIPTNELEEAVKSQIMNIVVVKKGQLQLYVGQSLEEVELALRTLIEQDKH